MNKIFLFGGLKEVTHESNETYKFDIETSTWEEICGGDYQTVHGTPTRLIDSLATVSRKPSAMDTIDSRPEVKVAPRYSTHSLFAKELASTPVK